MRICFCAAVTWNVLDDGQHAPVEIPLDRSAAEGDHRRRIGGKRPVADDVVSALGRHIQDRGTVHADSRSRKLMRGKAGAEIRGFTAKLRVRLVKATEMRRWR